MKDDQNTTEETGTQSSFAQERAATTSSIGGAGAAGAALGKEQGTGEQVKTEEGYTPYARTGERFTLWFNRRVGELANPTLQLGTKTATVLELHDDGRLECSVHGEHGEDAQQFVQFEAGHLDMLIKRLAVAGI